MDSVTLNELINLTSTSTHGVHAGCPAVALHRTTDSYPGATAGVCCKVFEEAPNVPVLGVCLGMQALAVAHGAAVQHAPYPVHGNLSGITHNGHPLFSGIPSGKSYPP